MSWSSPRCATTRTSATATRAGPRPTAQTCCLLCAQVGRARPALHLHTPSQAQGDLAAGPAFSQATWEGLRRRPCAPKP